MKTIVERMIKHFPSKMETDLLKGRVKDVPDMSMDKLAKNMNITYVTLWRKLHGKEGFFLTEMELEYLLRNRWLTIETEEKFSKL